MAKKYISLRGKFSLAPIVEGVVGAMRELGNIPDFTLEITADKIEHTESMSGDDTTDLVLYNTTAVSFSGTLEQVDADNLAYTSPSKKKVGVVDGQVATYCVSTPLQPIIRSG